MFRFRLRKPKILVVGSVLIDTVVVRPWPVKPDLVVAEDINTSIGGCAYSIAVHLGLLQISGGVGLFTYLPKKTATTRLVFDLLGRFGVSQRYVNEIDKLHDKDEYVFRTGGFAGIRDPENADLNAFGVKEPLSNVNFLRYNGRKKEFLSALRGCKAVIVDSGLNEMTIYDIAKVCLEKNICMIVHLVSPAKTSNLTNSLKALEVDELQPSMFCISGKRKEIEQALVFRGISQENAEDAIAQIMDHDATHCGNISVDVCTVLRAKHVLITPSRPDMAKGMAHCGLITEKYHKKSSTYVDNLGVKIQNYLGMSEAVCAAFVFACSERKILNNMEILDILKENNRKLFTDYARRAINNALDSPGATPSSVIVERDTALIRLPFHVRMRDLGQKTQNYVIGGFAILGAIVLVVDGFKSYPAFKQIFLALWKLLSHP